MPNRFVSFTVSNRDLDVFNREIGSKVQRALDLDSSRHLRCEKYEPVGGQRTRAYGLHDPGLGLVVTNKRSPKNYAFPVLQRHESTLLLSITFEWTKTSNRNRFVHAQFVVYLLAGAAARDLDPAAAQQILRLEWQGRKDDGTFEAPFAGHPHWQIDSIPDEPKASFAPASIRSMDQIVATKTRPSTSWLSRVHLASAAGGWAQDDGWSGDENDCHVHANPPETLAALSAWTTSGARYLLQQFAFAWR